MSTCIALQLSGREFGSDFQPGNFRRLVEVDGLDSSGVRCCWQADGKQQGRGQDAVLEFPAIRL